MQAKHPGHSIPETIENSMFQILIGLSLVSAAPVTAMSQYPHSAFRTQDSRIDRAARNFRIQVYRSFRIQRTEYNHRRMAGDRAMKLWSNSSQTVQDREAVLQWLRVATLASQPENVQPLAPLPAHEFTDNTTSETNDQIKLSRLDVGSLPLRKRPDSEDKEPLRIFKILGRAIIRAASDSAKPKLSGREVKFSMIPSIEDIASKQSNAIGDSHQDNVAESIDMYEMMARVDGYNLSLAALADELSSDGLWSVNRIEPLLMQLVDLSESRDLLLTYANASPGETTNVVLRLESPRSVVTTLGRRILEVRIAIEGDSYDGSEADRQAELAQIDAYSRSLESLVELP